MLRKALFALALAFAACTGPDTQAGGAKDAKDGSPEATADGGVMTPPGFKFGATCKTVSDQAPDCAMEACAHFMMLGNVCTLTCSADAQCPSGSMRQKCNMKGYCRP
jgi:hypothetical protein